MRLLVDTDDGKTIEIQLKGRLILRNSSRDGDAQASEVDQSQGDDDWEYLNNIRGWLLAVATLFVGMAFQAATQPPAWLPKPKVWFDKLGGKSAGDVTTNQATLALMYLFFNTVTFTMALTLVVLLMMMGHRSTRGRTLLLFARGFGAALAVSVSLNFAIGISDDSRSFYLVFSIIILYSTCTVFVWVRRFPSGSRQRRPLPPFLGGFLRKAAACLD